MRRIAVFCGSHPGSDGQFTEAALRLAGLLVRHGVGLVYGGARAGLMGTIADAVMAGGGEVIGVIPRALVDKEAAHTGLRDLRIVASMHERKALMAKLSSGFIALPGGLGTLEEICEMITWGRLGLHRKPCGLLNIGGYYEHLLDFIKHCISQGFIARTPGPVIYATSSPTRMLDLFLQHWAAGVEAHVP